VAGGGNGERVCGDSVGDEVNPGRRRGLTGLTRDRISDSGFPAGTSHVHQEQELRRHTRQSYLRSH
jgi:hypothetical protein